MTQLTFKDGVRVTGQLETFPRHWTVVLEGSDLAMQQAIQYFLESDIEPKLHYFNSLNKTTVAVYTGYNKKKYFKLIDLDRKY